MSARTIVLLLAACVGLALASTPTDDQRAALANLQTNIAKTQTKIE